MATLSCFEPHQSDYYDARTLGALWLATPEAVAERLPYPNPAYQQPDFLLNED